MLKKINGPVEQEMKRFNDLLIENYKNDNPFISTIVDYVMEQRGKQMRPLLVLLSAALHGKIEEKTYIGAMLVEMAHTASLIHDDIIDEAYMRRGKLSVNAIWRSKTAVLVGDYILARALSMTAKNNSLDLMEELIGSFEKLCEGELIQLEHSSKLDITEQEYFDVIYRKTASLLGSAGAIGAKSVGAPTETVKKMKHFGECIGMSFQIKDDLLDYQPSSETGKSAGNDLKERKITLPLLYLLNNSSEKERKILFDKLSTIQDNDKNIAYIQKKVIESGAVEYSEKVMQEYLQQSLDILKEYPESPVRESLELYCQFILERKK